MSYRFTHDFFLKLVVVVDVKTLRMARKPVKMIRRKVQQDALGKVNRLKEIRRREKDGLKITDNSFYEEESTVGEHGQRTRDILVRWCLILLKLQMFQLNPVSKVAKVSIQFQYNWTPQN